MLFCCRLDLGIDIRMGLDLHYMSGHSGYLCISLVTGAEAGQCVFLCRERGLCSGRLDARVGERSERDTHRDGWGGRHSPSCLLL